MKSLILGAAVALALALPAQAGSRSQAVAVSGSSSSSVSNSTGNTTSFQDRRQAPGVGLAGLAASGGCLGSASVGGSGAGFGFGFGGTYQDDRCNAREDARILASFGYRAQALQILINNSPMIREVMQPRQAAARTAVVATRARAATGGCQIVSKSGSGQCLD